MNKTNKENAQWWHELKILWNQFDPIGVLGAYSDWPDDEYESYIAPTFTRLEKEESFDQLKDWVGYIVRDYMGMEIPDKHIVDFVHRLREWYVRFILKKNALEKERKL